MLGRVEPLGNTVAQSEPSAMNQHGVIASRSQPGIIVVSRPLSDPVICALQLELVFR